MDGWRIRLVYFFEAEDGIRNLTVTGVQTCALPISDWHDHRGLSAVRLLACRAPAGEHGRRCGRPGMATRRGRAWRAAWPAASGAPGRECRCQHADGRRRLASCHLPAGVRARVERGTP